MTQLGGYSKSCPRTKLGIRIKTDGECAREANILLLTVTELEWQTMENFLDISRKATIEETDIREVITGLRN